MMTVSVTFSGLTGTTTSLAHPLLRLPADERGRCDAGSDIFRFSRSG